MLIKDKRGLFGKTWDVWDAVLLLLILASGFYLLQQGGWETLLNKFASAVFVIFIASFVIKRIKKKAKKK